MHSVTLLLATAAFCTGVAAVARRPAVQEGDDVFVTVENGVLRGAVATSLNGALYNQFLGIPYATPPLGDLRFRAPRPATSWSGVRDALSFADDCAQPKLLGSQPTVGSEDCLYLNVYAPPEASGPLPVMVHIHGGSFKTGSPSKGAPDFFVEKGAVLVSIAYRLGALGFLSLHNEDIPGNAGLKDQVLALRWVQNNIAAFGGDPSRVAIFGESAGGCSTSHLFVSPATKGLFSSVIMESGVATTPWALTDKPRQRAYRMAKALGFQAQGDDHTDDDDARLAAFLRAANYTDLIADDSIALSDFEKRWPVHLAFVPVVEPPSDSAVIVELPADILRAGSFNQVPIVLGVTSGEGFVVYLCMVHAGETTYLFADALFKPGTVPNSNDMKVSEQLTTLWTNLAKHGDPAPYGNPVVWEKMSANASSYLDMKLEFVTRQDLHKERMNFWREILSVD